jgi:hypothetical protein
MNPVWTRSVICLIAAAALAGQASGTRTRSFRLEGADSFAKGKMNGVSVADDGTVSPGPAAKLVAPDAGAQIWSLFRARDGVVYAGSGSDGTVYRLKGDRVEEAGDLFEYEVFTVVEGKDGRIFASGAPNGTVGEILPDGKVSTLFDTPEKVVWSLLADKEGNLYAGTGDRGYVYRITPRGEATVLYRSEDSHVVSLAWTKDGKIVAGTDGRGLLLEIDPHTGQGKVLYDAASPEIPKLVVGPGGEIYFAASGSIETEGASTQEAKGESDAPEAKKGGGLYLRKPDGTVRLLWECPETMIHSLCLDADGNVLAGTGDKAALYRISPAGDVALLWRPEEGQVLALLLDGESVLAATGNPGRIYRLGAQPDGEAWIRLEPVDSGSSASWGRAVWEVLPGSGSWQLSTRSGYTDRPDSSWSGWSVPSTDAEGSLVQSPPARFLQVEARFVPGGKGAPARLRRIWIPYGEPNLSPRITGIRLSPDDVAAPSKDGTQGSSFSQDLGGGIRVEYQHTPAPSTTAEDDGPPPWVKDVRSIAWDASDPNDDDLVFDVAIRQVGEDKFRTLVRDHPVAAYAIDTATLPDGSYEVRVIASDAPSNPPGEILTVERIGGPIRVDHRPPDFIELKAQRNGPLKLVVEGTARDEGSPLQQLEVSWDGRPWRPVGALDGFFDSREESFRVEIPLEREDEGSWVAARAFDAAGNEAVRRAWLAP